VFDGKDGTKRRRKMYPQYKSQRRVKQRFNRNVDWGTAPQDEEESMKMQLGRLVKYLEQLPLTIISIDGTEADDVIGYISKQLLPDKKIIISSTDKDFYQLIDDRITVWSPIKKILYTPEKIFQEFGIPSSNILTYRILEGDKSDNINGIRGAGLKTIKKCVPIIREQDNFDVSKLIKYVSNVDSKYKLIETIKNNLFLIKRNYILMQLLKVDISNHNKLRVQESIDKEIPMLIKYRFSTMFMQDKLWGQIPDMDSWITEFVRLNNYGRIKNNGG
jgi:5'-3' exonuclease